MSATQGTRPTSSQATGDVKVYERCEDHLHQLTPSKAQVAIQKVRAEYQRIFGSLSVEYFGKWVLVAEEGSIHHYYVKRNTDSIPPGEIVDDLEMEESLLLLHFLSIITMLGRTQASTTTN